METKEYFDLDPIMYYINTCTALTDTHTGFVCTGLPATFTYIQIRVLSCTIENNSEPRGMKYADFCTISPKKKSIYGAYAYVMLFF